MQGLQGSTKAPGCKAGSHWQSADSEVVLLQVEKDCPRIEPVMRYTLVSLLELTMNWRFISHATGQKTEQNASASERHVEFQAVGCSRNGHFIGQTSKKVEDKLFWPDCRKHPLPAGINNAASSTPFNVSETVWFRMISKVQHFNGTDQHWSTINFCWSVLSGSPNIGDAGPVMSHDVPIQSWASPQHVGARHACQMSPVRLCYQTLNENCAWSFIWLKTVKTW